jgi:hypothetical protein
MHAVATAAVPVGLHDRRNATPASVCKIVAIPPPRGCVGLHRASGQRRAVVLKISCGDLKTCPVQPALYRYAECVPKRCRLPTLGRCLCRSEYRRRCLSRRPLKTALLVWVAVVILIVLLGPGP